MKNQLLDPQFFQTIEETIKWLNKMKIKRYIIHPETLIVDVVGHVDLSYQNLEYLPIQFGKVSGNFSIYNNNLTNLKGSPEYVGHNFYCTNNHLESLKELINFNIQGEIFYSYNNKLSPLLECKENRPHIENLVIIPFNKLKKLLIIEEERKLLQGENSSYDNKNVISYIKNSNKIKI